MRKSLSERLLVSSALAGMLSLAGTPAAHANPTGGQVVGGSASISNSGNTLTVTQTSSRAIINWQSFDIGSGETTQFVQPSSSSIALNRVTGSESPSEILGTLNANGQVWIINPNGVMVGGNAQVNVAGLVATTANIADSDFMAGNYNFTQPGNANSTVSNAGQITVQQAGLVAFVAPNVSNSGTITAKLGQVQLASGDSFTLDLYGDGLINLQASPAVTQQIVSNSGTIQANGGQVLLTAAAAQSTVNSLINMSGVIQAESIGQQNGQIVLYAAGSNAVAGNVAANKGQEGGTSTVLVSGTLDASGLGQGETGGSISVLGDHVGILTGANINASGDAGGGTVYVGGAFHGQGATPTAIATVVESGSSITADAITSGNGGNVAVWSDNYTDFAGSISARGGAQSGNGGFVETSGKQTLAMSGLVDASAPNGSAGTWLMDPNNLVVNGSATSNAGSSPDWTAGSGGGNVLNTDIDAALNAGTSVDLSASGSIEFSASISKTAGGDATLTAVAGTDILMDSNVAISSTSGKLNTIFDADATNGGSGYILLNSGATISTNDGDIYMGGGTLDGSGHPTGYAVSTANHYGIELAGSNTLNAGEGAITLHGSAGGASSDEGIYVTGGSDLIETTTGNIVLGAQSQGGGEFELEFDSGTTVTTQTGSITLTGSAPNVTNAFNCIGVFLNSGVTISSTGTGSGVGPITITGNAYPNGGSYTFGIQDSATISSVDGNISISGTDTSSALDTPANGYNLGLNLNGTVTSTGNGNISITGVGDINNANNNYGILLNGLTVSAHNGSITLNGTGGGYGTNEAGIGTLNTTGNQILSTGTAPITLIGTGAHGSAGIEFTTAGNVIGGASDTGAITLNSNSDIVFNSANVTTDGAAVTLDADMAGNGGTISLTSSNIFTNGGNIVLAGGNNPGGIYSDTLPATGAAGDNVAGVLSAGVFVSDSSFTSGAGNIIIYGSGTTGSTGTYDDGIVLEYSTNLSTTTDNITLTGFGSTSPGSGVWGHDIGVQIADGPQLSTLSGNITITGTAYGASGDVLDHGVAIGGTITSTGTGSDIGAITINGTGAALGTGTGVEVLDGSNISSVDANIAITGTALATTSRSNNNGINIGTDNDAGITSGNAGGAVIASTGKGNIIFTATGGTGATDIGDLYGGAPPSNISTIGNIAGTGTITFIANTLLDPLDIQVQTAGQVIFKPRTPGTSIGVNNDSYTLNIDSSILSAITAGGITIGSTADTGTMNVNATTWSEPVTLLSGSGNIAINGTQSMGSHTFLADTTSGNITIGDSGGVSSTASGTAITLADSGGDFINGAGPSALSASNGRWLVYSHAPFSDAFGSLTSVFSRYGCTYGGDCPTFPSSGNGFLYSYYNPNVLITSQTNVAAQLAMAAEAIITDAEREPLYYILPVDYAALDTGMPKASLRPSAGEEPQDQGKVSITIMCSMNDNGSSMLPCSVLR